MHIDESASVVTIIMELAAEKPPMKANIGNHSGAFTRVMPST